jgi:hypothetical protein
MIKRLAPNPKRGFSIVRFIEAPSRFVWVA